MAVAGVVTTVLALAFDAGENEDLDVVEDPDDYRDGVDHGRPTDDAASRGGVEE